MSDFSLLLLEAPVLPPGHDIQIGAHLPELLALTVGLPGFIALAFLVLGAGPAWLRRSRASRGEVELSRQ